MFVDMEVEMVWVVEWVLCLEWCELVGYVGCVMGFEGAFGVKHRCS